jgi:hypothetical protein
MLDTTRKVSKEIAITCGLFLTILVIGTLAFDLYTKSDSTIRITSATVGASTQEQIKVIGDDEQQNAKNSITGTVVGITGEATADTADQESTTSAIEKQIGIYRVIPSFSFVDEYHLVDEYDTLQKEIRNFYKTIENCQQEQNPELEEGVKSCIDETLALPSYASWIQGEDCETDQEALFYDVTETFSQCLQSEDSDCVCVGTFDATKYSVGEYIIPVYQEGDSVLFTLLSTDLSVVLPNMHFAIEGSPMTYDEYTLHVEKEEATGGFSSLEPSSALYIYKQDAITLSVESQSTFSTYETTRNYCTLPSQEIYKFCVQSDTIVPVYDTTQETTTQQPLVYLFALSFPE